MALFAFFHYGHYLGTWLIIKAGSLCEAQREAQQLLAQPHYYQPAYMPQYCYQVTPLNQQLTAEIEERTRAVFHALNADLIKNGIL
jgi:hypothetical protein